MVNSGEMPEGQNAAFSSIEGKRPLCRPAGHPDIDTDSVKNGPMSGCPCIRHYPRFTIYISRFSDYFIYDFVYY